jgi:hypothetical protein
MLHFPDITSQIRFVANVVTTKEEGIFPIKYVSVLVFTSIPNLHFRIQYVLFIVVEQTEK